MHVLGERQARARANERGWRGEEEVRRSWGEGCGLGFDWWVGGGRRGRRWRRRRGGRGRGRRRGGRRWRGRGRGWREGRGEGFDWWMGGGRGGTIEFQRILKREI